MANVRLLVTGGRDFGDIDYVNFALDTFHSKTLIAHIINGACRGVDNISSAWARKNGVPLTEYPAHWAKYGLTAGNIRNQIMLVASQPDMVLAFPGGSGTQDMVDRALKANVPVIFARGLMN